MSFLATAVAALVAAPGAQTPEPRAKEPLPAFREAFAAQRIAGIAVAVGVRAGEEPVVLCSGTDARGAPITPLTLVPLGPLARVLAADAVHALRRGDLAVASGVRLGGKDLTVGELLAGSPRIPDYWSWSGGHIVEASTLLSCGELAESLSHDFATTTSGVGEFVLLEPFVFGEKPRDWTDHLRTTLAVHAPGLDPKNAASLTQEEKRMLPDDARAVASAQPSLLRLLIAPKNLATWWQWRMRQEVPLWTGRRMGSTWAARGGETSWTFAGLEAPIETRVRAYPDKRAAVLMLGGSHERWTPIISAFEDDLLGPPPEGGWNSAVGLGGGGRLPTSPLSKLSGTAWTTAADARAKARIAVRNGRPTGLHCEVDGRSWTSVRAHQGTRCLTVTLRPDSIGTGRELILWPQPDFEQPKRLSVVLVETTSKVASVPHYFDLEPAVR